MLVLVQAQLLEQLTHAVVIAEELDAMEGRVPGAMVLGDHQPPVSGARIEARDLDRHPSTIPRAAPDHFAPERLHTVPGALQAVGHLQSEIHDSN